MARAKPKRGSTAREQRETGSTPPAAAPTEPVEVEVLDTPPGDEDEDGARHAESDERTAAREALADVQVSDADLDAIEHELARRARAAPKGSTALARRDPMAAYMAEVRQHPLLTREEEYELAVRWFEHGDKDAAR